ncbi:hypothetical protein RFI_35636 [Reticulomyxa filosa]|uniref:G-protein beta WD-40 repeats containing protein n=1 Tax=Reticulomyxa filosa TaxID=46433 RepID=X6LIM4_RETFI|nr:hypothetical protein RFI_35636 [Reticulomyxa filosa]|eukprot:ETO01803.1 hypothetical protein RFI_35636 [Reticulomyxa filosa]
MTNIVCLLSYLTQTTIFFIFDAFSSSAKLIKSFKGHTDRVYSIDYSTFDDGQFLCSGSYNNTIRVWNIEDNKQIQLSNENVSSVYCVKFSSYHSYNYHSNVICFSNDNTIDFWDIKDSQQSQVFNGHTDIVFDIKFSPFNGNRYFCSGSGDNTIRLWDIEKSKSLYVFHGHVRDVWCVDISPLQSNSNNKSNLIGAIGGNGYTICSGSCDSTICVWDIETAKLLNVFKGHKFEVKSVKYIPNELGISGGSNAILSASFDKSIRLWDIQSGKQIQVFNGHTDWIMAVEYSPFIVNNNEFNCNSNVICSGSLDNTIRFWDIRSNKKELYVINGYEKDSGIICLKFQQLKKKEKKRKNNEDINLYYGTNGGDICVWG